MNTVQHLLRDKPGPVWSCTPETSVYDALKLMAEKEIGALLVLEGGQLAGIFSERDYARKIVLLGRGSKQTPVRDVMTTKVVCVKPEQTIEQCMALMTQKRIRHLPVLDGVRVVGVISIGDVVKSVISEKEFMIEQLSNYIWGTR